MRIEDSYKIRTRDRMIDYISYYRRMYPKNSVWNRSNESLIHEWRGHNLLYDLHLFRSHTADVDFEYPQKWYCKVVWAILSVFYIGK